jgi:hypothetical protein
VKDSNESYSATWVPKMFPIMAATLGKVHTCSSGVLWRWPLWVSC